MSLDEMQARCDAATPEWYTGDSHEEGVLFLRHRLWDDDGRQRPPLFSDEVYFNRHDDAEFAAYARTDMPRLIAALRVLKEASENVGNELCEMFDDNRALQLGASLSVALARVAAILGGK